METAPMAAEVIKARAELALLLRYIDAGVPVRRHNIERVLATLDAPPAT